MVKRFRTASTRITDGEWEKYQERCAEEGVSPHADLKKHIEEVIKENEPIRTVRETSATDERQTSTVSGSSEAEPAKRTVTINGKTYTY